MSVRILLDPGWKSLSSLPPPFPQKSRLIAVRIFVFGSWPNTRCDFRRHLLRTTLSHTAEPHKYKAELDDLSKQHTGENNRRLELSNI